MSNENSAKPVLEADDKKQELLKEREGLFAVLLAGGYASASLVPTKHNLPQLLSDVIAKADSSPILTRLAAGREIVALDCRKLIKGVAREWITNIAKRVVAGEKFIVIIENITDIPSGPANMYDDPQYVENILGHVWRDDYISIGDWDFSLDRSAVHKKRELSVILTSSPEHADEFEKKFRTDGYSWHEEFDDELERTQQELEEAQQELDNLE